MFQEGCPFLLVSKLIYSNHRLELSKANQEASANSSYLIG